MAEYEIAPFGTTQDGQSVSRITLRNGTLTCGILTYGGILAFLNVPNRDGGITDVALGFDAVADYEGQDKFIGALIGRCANRIADGRFTLNGKTFHVECNDGANHLHGGSGGFHTRLWSPEQIPGGVRLTRLSPHGEGGYPGALTASVTYTLDGDALSIGYEAQCDADTLCNLTSHTYFNLNGHNSGSVLGHTLQIRADGYTPTDGHSIPTGAIAPVEGTPMDFRRMTPIGARIGANFQQLRFGAGYDHNWVIAGKNGTLRPAARLYAPETGITLALDATLPGLQCYTGNHLGGTPPGKGGARYAPRSGLCLETQFFPNAVNQPQFPQPLLRAGEQYNQRAVFRFGTRQQDGGARI